MRGVPLPAFYARLWARMTKMPASAFQSDEVIRVGYHAHLVHARLLRDEDPVPDLEPSFERRAEELWFAQKKKVRVSAMQLEVGEALKRLGVAHVAEPPPFPGEFFGMDFHLPDFDVALECEGPHHYYAGARGTDTSRLRDPNAPIAPGQPGTVRNARTELRDAFPRARARGWARVPPVVGSAQGVRDGRPRRLARAGTGKTDGGGGREGRPSGSNANGEGNGRVARPGGWTTVDGIVTPRARRGALERVVAAAENDADACARRRRVGRVGRDEKRAMLREEVLARAADEGGERVMRRGAWVDGADVIPETLMKNKRVRK